MEPPDNFVNILFYLDLSRYEGPFGGQVKLISKSFL
jgi:hypothetical protein